MQTLKVTLEKQRSWTKEDLEKFLELGVGGFTITDLPFSSVIQAYWFWGACLGEAVFGKFSWWQDTDSHFFYQSIMGKKSAYTFLSVFWKLHTRLLDHHDSLEELSYTPEAILSVAANGHSNKYLENKIDVFFNVGTKSLFLVSGGGVLQRFFKKFFPFNFFLSSSNKLFSYARNKYPNLTLYAAANPNLKSENVNRLLNKHFNIHNQTYINVDKILTQPPFVWSRFEKYLQTLSENQYTKNIPIHVGVPVFTNAWNVRFWMQLVSVNWRKEEEAKNLVRLFEEKYFQDKSEKRQEFKEFSKNWTLQFISKIKNLQSKYPQIVGVHLMPMGNSISIENILLAVSQEKTASTTHTPTKIKYDSIKYKNHFYEQNENLQEGDKIYLEKEFVPQHQSIIWYFNKMFWDHLDPFMQAIEKDYKKSIGGTADSNTELTKYSARQFADQVMNSKLENLAYVELGAASCDWAKEFISEYIKVSGNTEKTFAYIFTDFSQDVLDKAKAQLGDNYLGISIQYLLSDKPIFKKILRIHATNIYDNYPHERFLLDHGKLYQIYLKTYISKENVDNLISKYSNGGLLREKILNLITNFSINQKKYSNQVETFLHELEKLLSPKDYYNFWLDFWNTIKFEEKYIPTQVNQTVGKVFKEIPNEKIEFSTSVETERDILRKINMLAPDGCLEIIDIIANTVEDYKNFLGPVKYDASLANYLNGPLLRTTIFEKYPNISIKSQSLKSFGGKRNQTILEITKESL